MDDSLRTHPKRMSLLNVRRPTLLQSRVLGLYRSVVAESDNAFGAVATIGANGQRTVSKKALFQSSLSDQAIASRLGLE